LKTEVANLKTQNEALQAKLGTEVETAKLSASKDLAKAERERASNIAALCGEVGMANLSAKYIADETPIVEVQAALLKAVCEKNKPIGDGSGNADLSAKDDPNAKYKAEYKAQEKAYLSAGITEADYIQSRLIDDGKAFLTTK
jgi:hypothetical protein